MATLPPETIPPANAPSAAAEGDSSAKTLAEALVALPEG
jgi:hypothetical protein